MKARWLEPGGLSRKLSRGRVFTSRLSNQMLNDYTAICGQVFPGSMSLSHDPKEPAFCAHEVVGDLNPPTRITGGSNTEMAETMIVTPTLLVDWLRVTLPSHPDALERAKLVFGPGLDWEHLDFGRLFYKQCLRRGHVSIYFDGNGGTVCVDVSGKGCRQLEAEGVLDVACSDLGLTGGWSSFLSDLISMDVSFPRLDWAIDDRQGLIKIDSITKALSEGRCLTRFRRFKQINEGCPSSGEKMGEGYTFGSRESLMFVRIYNKQLERLSSGDVDPGQLMRVEVESKGDKAMALVKAFIAEGASAIVADLWAMLDFKDASEDSNRSRWSTCEWWADFLNAVEKCRVAICPSLPSLESAASAFVHQWAPMLGAILTAFESQGDRNASRWLAGVLTSAQRRWRPRHVSMISSYLLAATG